MSTIFAACLAVAFSGAAVAIASSGKDGRAGGSTTGESTTNTTGTTTTPAQGTLRRSRQILGRVTAIDAAAKKFDLRVSKRRGSIRRGTVLTITTTDATRYEGLAGFDAITVGRSYKVKIRRAADDTLVAKTVEPKGPRRHGDDNDRRGDDDGPNGDNDGPNHDKNDDSGSGISGRR